MRLCFEERAASELQPGDRVLIDGALRAVAGVEPLTLDPHGDQGWPADDRERVEVILPRSENVRPYRLLRRPGDALLVAVPL